MFNWLNAFKFYEDKKLMLKVIAGILLIAIAFSVYLTRNIPDKDQVIISNLKTSSEESQQLTTTEEAVKVISEVIIDVSGAVINPKVVQLAEGSRVFEAIESAGGLREDAYTKNINLAKILTDGEKLYIPSHDEVESGEINVGNPGYMSVNGNSQSSLININTADSVTLQMLSGIGPSMAEKIINYRNEHGNFRKIEDLKNVSGIGDKTFEKFKNKITV